MRDSKISIKVYTHTDRPVDITVPDGIDVERPLGEGEPEIGFPGSMLKAPPGLPVELSSEKVGPGKLVFVTRGRKADLTDKGEEIAAARAAGRSVEVHIFDDPKQGS
jgi:hypothetical protein